MGLRLIKYKIQTRHMSMLTSKRKTHYKIQAVIIDKLITLNCLKYIIRYTGNIQKEKHSIIWQLPKHLNKFIGQIIQIKPDQIKRVPLSQSKYLEQQAYSNKIKPFNKSVTKVVQSRLYIYKSDDFARRHIIEYVFYCGIKSHLCRDAYCGSACLLIT